MLTHRKRFLKTHREKREKMLTHRKRYSKTRTESTNVAKIHRETSRINFDVAKALK